MEDIITITQEELDYLKNIKTFKELVFCYYKYHCHTKEDFFEEVTNYATWKDIQQASKLRSGQNVNLVSFIGEFNDRYYNPISSKISKIKCKFNADNKIDLADFNEVQFWYKMIFRIHLMKETWDKIISIDNENRIGFVQAYNSLRSISAKKEFLEEVDYFINKYKNLLLQKKDKALPSTWFDNVMESTNRPVLEIIWSFDRIDIQKCIDELRILSTDDLINSGSYRKSSRDYVKYLKRITEEISSTVEKVNQEFKDINTFISFENVLEGKLPASADDNQELYVNEESEEYNYIIEKYIVDKLHEIDYTYYKDLSIDNYESFINEDQPNLTEAQKKKRTNKIRNDIMTIIEKSPKLAKYIYDHPLILWGLDIILI